MWPGMIGQRESAERKFRFNKEVLQQILEVWFLTDRWLCSTEGSALGLGLIGGQVDQVPSCQVDRPKSGRAWTKADQPLSVSSGRKDPNIQQQPVYRGPTQLEKCTIWPAKPSRNVGKVVVWTCHGKRKYREYQKNITYNHSWRFPTYMQKAGDCGDISPQFFFNFPQNFRLRTRNQYCTQAIAWGSTI